MMADLSTALSSPLALVQSIYARSSPPSLDGIEDRVGRAFAVLLSPAEVLAQVAVWRGPGSAEVGQVVRFRGMVQDTGLGAEVFLAESGGRLAMFGAGEGEAEGEEGEGGGDEDGVSDYRGLRERQTLFVVEVPGQTDWASKKLHQSSAATGPNLLANKFPNPAYNNVGLVTKLYGDAADALKITNVVDFVGILGETTIGNDFSQLTTDDSTPLPPVPALHVLFTTPVPAGGFDVTEPSTNEAELATLKSELVEYLAGSLGGDKDAAEWVVLAVLARIHTRHPTGLALGSLALNLSLPRNFATDLAARLATVLPALTTVDLSIPILNSPDTRLAPRNRDENLESGRLQLGPGTAVVVDMRAIGEGTLADGGVRNLRALATAVAQQKLEYSFPYSSFELDTDLNFVLLSEGKAIIPADCVVCVEPVAGFTPAGSPDEATLDQFRSFLATFKHAQFNIPPEMSNVIQADFVERRQKSIGGEGITQEDLLFRMTVARLMALSSGKRGLDKAAWLSTAELDERRKDKLPVVPKA